MKRWTLRILLALLIVIVVAIVIAQIVLWTDFPRTLVMRLVQQQLGLRVEAKTLSTGWFGSTTLSDVKVSLPLAEESFLSMPTMEVDHTALIPLLLTQKFRLDGIELHKPNLIVRRDANGRWNLQDVAELIAKATAGGTPVPGTKTKPPKLPRLRLSDGTVTIIEHNGAKAIIAPLTVTGDPQGPLVYKYDARVPDHLTATGQVAPGEDFKHEVELFAAPSADLMKLWTDRPPTPLMAKARWAGTVDDGRVIGRLTIDEARYEKLAARGRVVVQAGRAGAGAGLQAIINPQDLVITTDLAAVPEVQLASGALSINGSTIRAQQVRVSALGGSAQLDGSGDIAAKNGELSAQWLELPGPAKIQHAGSLKVKLETPFPGGPVVAATLNTRGTLPQGHWDGEIHADGRGRSWTDMSWEIRSRRLAWEGKQPVLVENFSARVAQRDKQITLQSVDWPGHQLIAEGQFDAAAQRWFLRARGSGVPTARAARAAMTATGATPLEFNIDARGDRERITLNEMLLRAPDLEAKLRGAYVYHLPKPVALHFTVTHVPSPSLDTDPPTEPPIRGRLVAEGNIEGTSKPINLAATGSLHTHNLAVLGREFGDIDGQIAGQLTDDAAKFNVRQMQILGGVVDAVAVWPYSGADRLVDDSGPVRATITAEHVKLKELGDLLKAPIDGGDVRGEWIIDIPLPRPRPSTIAMTGSFTANKFAVAGEKFQADEVTGQTSLKNGLLSADPITLRRAERDVSGTATAIVQTTLADPQRPTIVLDTKTWPLRVSATATAAVTASTHLVVDAAARDRAEARAAAPARASTDAPGPRGPAISAVGPITARVMFATTQRALGGATLDGRLDGRALQINQFVVDAIGGRAQGSGILSADDPNQSTLTLSWSDIAGERIAELLPQLNGLGGTYSGAVTLAPATAERALEPLRLTLGITPQAGRFRAMEIGPAKFSAYLNMRPDFSLERIVLDAAPSEIRASQQRDAAAAAAAAAALAAGKKKDGTAAAIPERPLDWNEIKIADGRIRVWGRRGRHPGDLVSTHLIVDFQRLDIDQLVRAFKPESEPMPGRLGGSITLNGTRSNLDEVFGQGKVAVTESDLANVDALALLYNATQLGRSTTQPTGNGSLDISLQASTLSLQNIRYFNRGVQARSASVDISDIWHLPHSKIFGYIVGSARPLKDLKLPILADVDQILNVVQTGLTTVKVDGTVAEPKAHVVAFSEASDALKRFIVGEVNTETRAK